MKNIGLAGLAAASAVSLFAQSAFAYQVDGFTDYYQIEQGNLYNWNLTKSGAADNSRHFASPPSFVSLQGTSSALGTPMSGTYIELWIVVPDRQPGEGDLVAFTWQFETENNGANPNPSLGDGDRVEFFYGIGGQRVYTTLADNQNGVGTFSIMIPLDQTQIGWRVSSDNDITPDTFLINNFTAPSPGMPTVPETGSGAVLLSGLFLAVAGFFCHRPRKVTA